MNYDRLLLKYALMFGIFYYCVIFDSILDVAPSLFLRLSICSYFFVKTNFGIHI